MHHAQALTRANIPDAHGTILAAAEQAAAVGGERQACQLGGMSPQRRSIALLFDIPEPDRLVKAAARQDGAIGTPGDTTHPVGMPAQRLLQAHAGYSCTEPFGSAQGKLRRN